MITKTDENYEKQGDGYSCECGSLSGSIHDGLKCNMCDTVCSGENMATRIMSNTIERPFDQNKSTNEIPPIVNVTIEQQKTSSSLPIAFSLSSLFICGSILLAAWFLKR